MDMRVRVSHQPEDGIERGREVWLKEVLSCYLYVDPQTSSAREMLRNKRVATSRQMLLTSQNMFKRCHRQLCACSLTYCPYVLLMPRKCPGLGHGCTKNLTTCLQTVIHFMGLERGF